MTRRPAAVPVLVVDNDDSFTYTLCDYLAQAGAEVTVIRSHDADAIARELPRARAVVISPGPGAPADAGGSAAVVADCAARRIPLLGVCLGHQVIAEHYGARVAVAASLMHGKTSRLEHTGEGLYARMPQGATVGRYHSLAVAPGTLRPPLVAEAHTPDGVIMGFRHETLPMWGVQFHPESILTPDGMGLLEAWLAQAAAQPVQA